MVAIRVLVVDDSVVIRRLLTDLIDADPDFEVVGTASNGQIALDKMTRLNPDVVTLDVEMPVLDGLQTLRAMRERGIERPTVMFSTLTERGAAATLDAMQLGAADYVTKPSNSGSFDVARERVRDELFPKLRALGRKVVPTAEGLRTHVPPPSLTGQRCELVAIGSSTGGPNALTRFFEDAPAEFAAPIVVTQHMPPVFTGLLAKRLDAVSPLHVVEAEDGMVIEAGTAYIAPGDHHLTLHRGADDTITAALDQNPPENSCRPAVDPMFRSIAMSHGPRALGVILTGMGYDGLVGSKWFREAGAQVFVQDAATSVVWGMPGAVAEAGLADAVLPLDALCAAVRDRVGTRRMEVLR